MAIPQRECHSRKASTPALNFAMLEWLATIGTAEISKSLFEQVLKLGQAAAEDYVKDFFKGCLKAGIASANPTVAKQATAEAVKAFLLLMEDELLDQEIAPAEVRDRYEQPLLAFVQDDIVKPILGQAFEQDCRRIAVNTLATTWQQQQPFPPLPTEFDWERIGREYLRKVRRIVREKPELRSLLDTELLEDIARNTSQLSPGFDVTCYRQSLQQSYGYLRLSTVDTTDQQYRIRLWQMFIEPTVREALPPSRYELPLDLQRQLHAEAGGATEFSAEMLEHYRRDSFQQPTCKALTAIGQTRSSLALHFKEGTGSQRFPFQGEPRGREAHAQRAVILGDPGSGKSTLLQYLALNWAEAQTSEDARLPLLIELREYALSSTNNFLEFLHRGKGADWQFDQQELDRYLREHPSLIMFDGLDEIFDRPTQAATVDDIIRFAQCYPQAQILVTSRVIGYNPDRFQHADFRQFTIQPLDTDEIHEFINRWYDLAMGSDPDRDRLKQRLNDAIANSQAIANLADNPLLLTMMAILNRRQELPRDRADLYDQASRVLLYHWDVDHKRLNLPMDAIGRREKQALLRAIAYDMQAGEAGLKGNLIECDRLTRIITDYLRDQGYSEPREKASALIQQLRERNFILCYRGADTYGFVHRTFLEYFCAMEIVHRFEKQRTLAFEQLRDDIFGNHWQDETWHEVLRLICGAIDPKFAGELIEFLMGIEVDRSQFLDTGSYRPPGSYLSKEAINNLLLAIDCVAEVKTKTFTITAANRLLDRIKREIEVEKPYTFGSGAGHALTHAIAVTWAGDKQVLTWLKALANEDKGFVRRFAVSAIVQGWKDESDTLLWLKELSRNGKGWYTRERAVRCVAEGWKGNPDTLPWLKALTQLQHEDDWAVRRAALEKLAEHWKDDPDALPIVVKIAQSDEIWATRHSAIETLAQYWGSSSDLSHIFSEIAVNDPGGEKGYLAGDPRCAALEALITHYPTHPKTSELLRDRAENDPDEQLREWAQEQLKKLEIPNHECTTEK